MARIIKWYNLSDEKIRSNLKYETLNTFVILSEIRNNITKLNRIFFVNLIVYRHLQICVNTQYSFINILINS